MTKQGCIPMLMCGAAAIGLLAGPAMAAGDPIRVGIVEAQTGPLADAFGIPTMEGALLALEQINAAGGIKGRQLEPVVRDDRTQVQGSVIAFQELARDPAVVAMIGPSISGGGMAVRPIINQNTLPELSISYGPALVKGDFTYFYRVGPGLDTGNQALLADVQKRLGSGQKLAIIASTDAGGTEGADDAVARASQYGMTVVANERYQYGDTDLTAQLTRVKAAGATVLLSLTQGVLTNAMVHGIKQLGMDKITVIGPNGLADAQSASLAGNLLNGVVFWDYVCLDDTSKPAVAKLREEYAARFKGKELSPGVVNGYDMMRIIAAGLEKVVDGSAPVDRKALNAQLTHMTFDGIGTQYVFTPEWHNGPTLERTPICTFQDGKRIPWKS
jgi:branched-chain amino acid transport system substrate-binding protein